ncbi:MAG: glycosyltransferase family 39 protein [Candidatus Altiarchaeota archaeon]
MRKLRKPGLGVRELKIALVLFLIAFGVRYYFKSAGLWHTDSVIGARAAEDTLATGRLHYLQGELGYPGEAVLMTLTYAVFKLLGATSAESAVLFAGVLFGALCIPAAYLLARRLFNSDYAGIYAGLILTFLPVHLSLSTYGKGHGMELFFLLLSAYVVLEAGERKSLRLLALASCLLGFTMAIRQTSALLFPAFILLYAHGSMPVEVKKSRKKTKIMLSKTYGELLREILVLAVPAFIVFTLFFVPKMMDDPSFSLPGKMRSVGSETNRGFGLFTPNLTKSLDWATFSLTWIGWVLFLGGLYYLWVEDRHLCAALSLWFLAFFMYLGNLISTSPRFVIPALAVPVVMMSYSLDRIRLRYKDAAAGIVLFILVSLMMYNIYPIVEYRRSYCGPCEFAKRIREVTGEDSLIIAMDESQHYEYYARRNSTGHPSGNDLIYPDKIKAHLDYLEGVLRHGTSVYATTQGLGYDILIEDFLAYSKEDMMLKNTQTGKVYSNLRFDISRGELYDLRTKAVLPLTGMYGLELYDRFDVTPVFSMENEDWHHKGIERGVYRAVLYNISLREVPDEVS